VTIRRTNAVGVAVIVAGSLVVSASSDAGAGTTGGLGFNAAVYLSAQSPWGPIGFGVSSAIGDVSGDGRADLVVASNAFTPKYQYEVLVYKQTATHGLSKATIYPLPNENGNVDKDHVFLADMNGDGRTDVVVATVGGVDVLLQGAHGGLHPAVRVPIPLGSMEAVADLDGDGHPDIVALVPSTNGAGGGFQVFWGKTATTFTPGPVINLPTAGSLTPETSIRIGDLNGDHRPDIVVTGSQFWTSLQGSGRTFSTPTHTYNVLNASGLPTGSSGADVGDVNGDGLADVVLSTSDTSGLEVFYGQANGLLSAPRFIFGGINTSGVTIGDLNGDGRNDIAVMNGGWNSITTILQQPDGSLADAEHYIPIQYPQDEQFGMAIGDLNGDGLADIALVGAYQAIAYQTNPRPDPSVDMVGGGVTLAGPATAKAGVAFTVSGHSFYSPLTVQGSGVPPFTGQTMYLQTGKTSAGPWSTVTKAVTDNQGNYAAVIRLTTSAYVNVIYPGTSMIYPMTTLPIDVKVS
jgi:hypothetical protein